jgi:Carboxypeptidase regulatory-like domain
MYSRPEPRSAIVLVALCLAASALPAQIRVTGTITDSAGQPLPSIRVSVDSSSTVLTDGNGIFAVPSVSPGNHV